MNKKKYVLHKNHKKPSTSKGCHAKVSSNRLFLKKWKFSHYSLHCLLKTWICRNHSRLPSVPCGTRWMCHSSPSLRLSDCCLVNWHWGANNGPRLPGAASSSAVFTSANRVAGLYSSFQWTAEFIHPPVITIWMDDQFSPVFQLSVNRRLHILNVVIALCLLVLRGTLN